MRILVFGAGVLGSLYVARLSKAGERVEILARGGRLTEIQANGIVLEDMRTGVRETVAVPAVDRIDPDATYDVVVVLVRCDQLSSALEALAEARSARAFLVMANNAAGPDAITEALGVERVLLGFAGAGGNREDGVVRYRLVPGFVQPTTLGELDGLRTDRLFAVERAIRGAGFPTEISPDMDAWLKIHAAMMTGIANALYAEGVDVYRLAKSKDRLAQMVRAVREGFAVVRALGMPVTPPKLRVYERLPIPLLVAVARRAIGTGFAETAPAGHAEVAKREMRMLTEQLQALAREAGVATPAIDALAAAAYAGVGLSGK